MKKLFTILFVSFMVTFAYGQTSFTVNGIKYTTTGTNKVEVSSGVTYTGAITIPSSVTYSGVSYSVTSIGINTFGFCFGLTSVTIPSSVTSIGSDAFYSCTGLTSVTIPSSVTSIENYAFADCTGLITVDTGNLNYSSLDGVLYNKTKTLLIQCPISKTGSFTIPSSVTSIGGYAFYSCTGLTSVTIPASVTSIGDRAFEKCTGLTSVTIPLSVTSIGDYAFRDCTGLITVDTGNLNYSSLDGVLYNKTKTLLIQCPTSKVGSFIILSSVTSIGIYAFYSCNGLTSVTIPTSVTSIGSYAFSSCKGLTSVTIPTSVTSIGSGAFSNCSGLTSITIPSLVTSIGSNAFFGCTGLAWVTIPSSVTSIGEGAFENCTGLITIDTWNLNYSSLDGVLYNKTKTLLIQCPISKTGSFTIPSSVTSIGRYAFYSCTGLTSVTIPSSVTSIEWDAFQGCTGLTSVTIPSSVTSINSYAFSYCTGLTSMIAFPANPINLTSSSNVFYGINKTTCILYVPSTSLSLYKSANQWKDFTNIFSLTPSITTNIISSISNTTALTGGNITNGGGLSITSRGVCWSTTTNPTVANSKTNDGIGIGLFSSNITGLSPGTTYHVRAYATNSAGTAYGDDKTFTTLSTIPSISTAVASLITGTTATTGGNITNDGGYNVTARGVCWSTTANPTITNSKTNDGTGIGKFISNITELNPTTTYHIRAYATNSAGTAYGDDLTFTTQVTINTTVVSLITGTTATSGGNITSDGEYNVIARGVCWSSLTNPTILNSYNKTVDGTGSGTFSSNIIGLTPVTTYHIRAYATNSLGTAYGDDLTFTTLTTIPILRTTVASSITGTSAIAGGNITNDGGLPIVSRGVCWSNSVNPTISNNKTIDGSGSGVFSSNITGLTPGTTYHIRAYATNSAGTAYGSDLTFTTLAVIPTINTIIVSLITGTSAYTGGNITNDGGATIISRGVCWSTTANPTISNSKTTDGTGTGSFSSKITGLNPGTTYHVRAYATNSAGTAYGSDITFTTLVSSTEVYLNNIAFISSAQDGAQSNVPSTMVMNSTNPYNFMNPGKTIRFKMQCFNKKSNGINIVSGSCKVRCNDPYFTLTDSTSGLNNVGYNASAWSSDEFEIQIKSTTPWGYVGYVDFEVIEGSNSYFTYKVPIPIAPLSLQSKTVDDDNNPDSKGNGNGICEPNEIIESLPSLKNVSSLSANSVYGLFNNYYDVSGISIWNNKQGVSGTVVNSGYWNYAFGAPQVITAGTKDMIPQWDFVFDYNFTNTYHFTIGLIMSGKFQLFSGYQSYIRWLVPVEYNTGSPEFNTGIRNKQIQELTVYPNPTYGKIKIVLDVDNMNEYTINLSNVLGQKVYSSQLNTEKLNLDLSNYCSKGIYFLQLLNNKGIIVGEKKIIFN